MNLSDIRKNIDATDQEIKTLLMRRMGYSHQVAEAKLESGDTTIFRADREQLILESLGSEVDDALKAEYLAVVRKIMEASRMYQYGLIFDWNPRVFQNVAGHELANTPGHMVRVRLSRADKPNAMSAILSMIGDYGYNMERMEPVDGVSLAMRDADINRDKADAGARIEGADDSPTVSFELTIRGNLAETSMQKLMFQLDGECLAFKILENLA